jgi:hypothetical protein
LLKVGRGLALIGWTTDLMAIPHAAFVLTGIGVSVKMAQFEHLYRERKLKSLRDPRLFDRILIWP